MIYQYTKRYLKENFIKPKIDFVWQTSQNLEFFNYLHKRYNDTEITKEISEVKEAFRDFFEPIGTLLFRYSQENGLKIKIFPYRITPQQSKYLQNIVKIIQDNKKAIIYPYKGQTDQIAITGSIRRKINLEINDIDEAVNKKELIKYAIRQALELGKRDVVVQFKRKYLVKLFTVNKVLAQHNKELKKREGVANRYNGYTEKEIKENYNLIFQGDMTVDDFFQPILKRIFLDELNFSEIDNHYYEEKSLKILHNAIAQELENYLSLEDDFLFGLAGYILREHFYKVHEIIAIELLEKVFFENENANNFLHYFTGQTRIKNGKKYKIPSLETADGKQWNLTVVLGLSGQWINTKLKIQEHKNKLLELEQKIKNSEGKYSFIVIEIKKLNKVIKSTEQKLTSIKEKNVERYKKISDLVVDGKALNSEEIQLKSEIKNSELEIKELEKTIIDSKKRVTEFKTSTAELKYYNHLHREMVHKIDALTSNLNSNMDKVKLILDSLTKALMSRTKLISEE